MIWYRFGKGISSKMTWIKGMGLPGEIIPVPFEFGRIKRGTSPLSHTRPETGWGGEKQALGNVAF